MSHYIQDNQAVVITADKKILLFIKGGDNNVFSYENKRCTSWSFHVTFDNVAEYNDYITTLMMSDIAGGSWQFASLKNKSFYGYTEYEKTVYNRFDKALKNPLVSSWNLSDVNTENIYEFESSLEKLFRDKKISLNNESGIETNLSIIWSHTDEVSKEEVGVERLNKTRVYDKNKGEQEYKNFCLKYADKPLSKLVHDTSFCAAVVSFKKDWNNSVSILESLTNSLHTKNYSFANFNILLNSNEETVEDLISSYSIDSLLEAYPSQFETLVCLSAFNNKANKIIVEESKKEKDYHSQTWRKNFEKILNADYAELKAYQNIQVEEILGNAKGNFIEAWNDLIARCYYKNTNEQLPRFLTILKESIAANTFTLEDVKDDCENDFYEIVSHHRNQYKKNQSAIKKMFKELINEYTILFNERSIDVLCEYFSFQKPLKKEIAKGTIVKRKAVVTVLVEKTIANDNTSLTLFDFAS